MSFLRHKKIYQSDGLKRELNCSFSSLTDHRSDESSTGYSFMSCSPAELMSASPAPNSFSLNLVAVKPAAANHNCPSFSLSQPKGPLQTKGTLIINQERTPKGWGTFRPSSSQSWPLTGPYKRLLHASEPVAWGLRCSGLSAPCACRRL